LGRALALAEPEGYIRLFLDEGAPMLVLLRQAYARQITPGYVVTLLEAAGEQVIPTLHRSTSRSSQLMDSLTAREREVLRLLVDGASNREIANHLVLSVNTVKKHVWNLCGKLGVQSRAQAIAEARKLQML
jgi:LuxR family transcriptional regulator, maltose regulon positive regulatory protein